jgi:hypothetical protein
MCGGGIDSTALAVAICSGQYRAPDLSVYVASPLDSIATTVYVHSVISPNLARVGNRLQIIDAVAYTLTGPEYDIFDSRGRCILPAYTTIDGKPIKLRNWCNSAWKVRPARHWLREEAGVTYTETWLGLAADESRRATPSKNKFERKVFPLIDLGWTRERCIYEIARAGWPMPKRSSCIICPSRSDAEWRELTPAEFELACQTDAKLREKLPGVFLYRKMIPLEQAFPECGKKCRQNMPENTACVSPMTHGAGVRLWGD